MNTEDLQVDEDGTEVISAVGELAHALNDCLHDYNIAKNGTDEDVANQGQMLGTDKDIDREYLLSWSENNLSDAIASVDAVKLELDALYDKMFNS